MANKKKKVIKEESIQQDEKEEIVKEDEEHSISVEEVVEEKDESCESKEDVPVSFWKQLSCFMIQHKKRILFLTGIFTLVFLVVFSILYFLYPKINLKGKQTVVLSLNEDYKEPGYSVSTLLGNYQKKIKTKGKVDSNVVGDYTITYQVKVGPFSSKRKRLVKVIDKEKPTIQLLGQEEAIICPNGVYEEEGYHAVDNYDGDLTDKVQKIIGEDHIKYKVSDSSGNSRVVERKISKKDSTAPLLTLNGNENIYLRIGSSYQELGATAVDGCDGDLTGKISIEGSVDTSKIGVYPVVYRVQDSSGNEASVTRNVQVIPNTAKVSDGIFKYKTIYLTFDDGPSVSSTPVILDILKEENVKATFFVINHDDSVNYLIERAHREGHTIALHSYTHNYASVYASVDAYFSDLQAIHDKVLRLTGVDSKIIRFPGGSSNTVSRKYSMGIMSILVNETLNRGYRYYDWNVSSGDAGNTKDSNQIYQNVIQGLHPDKTNIVLMHDFANNYGTMNALRSIIQYGKQNGYTFSEIDMTTPMVQHSVAN